MSLSAEVLKKAPLTRGQYCPARPSDVRSSCPLVNSLANHGFLPRDGRNAHVEEFLAGMREIGLSSTMGSIFSQPLFFEHQGAASKQPRSFLHSLWCFICNPWYILSHFGMRRPGQIDSMGKKCLDLDQLDLHGLIEHDISMTRHDGWQGDSSTMQPDLVDQLLSSSTDGGKTLSAENLAAQRRRRITEQKEANPKLDYGSFAHKGGCAELALVLGVFGDGKKVRWDYARALFSEERLPIQEGWKRRWWTMGVLEFQWATDSMGRLIGVQI